MSDIITYRSTRDEMLFWLEENPKEVILAVIGVLKDLIEDEYPYQIKVSGTKADLINELSEVPKRLLWHALGEVFPDANEEKEKQKKTASRKRQNSKSSDNYDILHPKDIALHSFDLSILNLDQDPNQLLKRIENFYRLRNLDFGFQNLTALFSGPSGAGKTHLIQFLSKKLNRPVMLLSASAFLSKFVGDTEKNTKNIFSYAEKKDYIVFIDEIEGLLQSRAGADHSWEKTQVNELLVRLEKFKGVCIGATNLYQSLDPAFYRRFTLKVEFSFMKKEVRWPYVKNKFHQMMNTSSSLSAEDQLKKIDHLTPGDIESVYRRLILDGIIFGPQEIVSEIEREVSSKKHVFQKKINLN